MRRRAAIAGLAGFVAACAVPRPRLSPPTLGTARVRVVAFSFPTLRLAVDVVLHNPNPVDIDVEGAEVFVDVEGETVSRSTLLQPARLPAGGESTLRFDSAGHLGTALAGLARSLDRRGAPLRYAVRGRVTLADGTSVPFIRRGELAWS